MSFVDLFPDIPKASKGHDKHLRTIYGREQLYRYGYGYGWIMYIWMMVSLFLCKEVFST